MPFGMQTATNYMCSFAKLYDKFKSALVNKVLSNMS